MENTMKVSTLLNILSMLTDYGYDNIPVVVKTNAYTYAEEYSLSNVDVKFDNNNAKVILNVKLIKDEEES